jgi:hypothetical protein
MRFLCRLGRNNPQNPINRKIILDWYTHSKTGITLCRVTTVQKNGRQWTHWECPQLGDGEATLRYWLAKAHQQPT